ncbi:FmdB family zinc ribbon protein [Staphylococcus sp. Marseille-Q5304]|uniref:FmdB family zinc ribbon protein n=1 Tax=Staphylococcus sp. Marseille-Q5304 TaxID=2942200 RepID=UPI002072B6A3|nr:FmdB family zinc ribbon protein [Staphylococcus sp. Marseille-Q5304]
MPQYTYACPKCDEFTLKQSINDSHETASCPTCGSMSKRVFTAFQTNTMNTKLKKRIEQGQEPKVVSKDKLPKQQRKTPQAPRPWMAGH